MTSNDPQNITQKTKDWTKIVPKKWWDPEECTFPVTLVAPVMLLNISKFSSMPCTPFHTPNTFLVQLKHRFAIDKIKTEKRKVNLK
jgi:hypothetical protein